MAQATAERTVVIKRADQRPSSTSTELRVFKRFPKMVEGVTTSAAGAYDATKANLFKASATADAQGVFGSMPGVWPSPFFYFPGYVMPTDVAAPEYDGSEFTTGIFCDLPRTLRSELGSDACACNGQPFVDGFAR